MRITSLFPRGGGSELHAGPGRRHARELVRRRLRLRASRPSPTSTASRSCADRRAPLFGSDAIGGVVQRRDPPRRPAALDGLVEGGGLGTVRSTVGAAGVTRQLDLGCGRRERRAATDSPARRRTASGQQRRLRAVARLGTLAGSAQRDRIFLSVHRRETVTSADFPDHTASIPLARSAASIGSHAASTTRDRSAVAFDASRGRRRVRQRIEASYTDLSSEFVSALIRSGPVDERHAAVRRAGFRKTSRSRPSSERVGRRRAIVNERAEHVRHRLGGAADPDRAAHRRHCSARAATRAAEHGCS